MIVAAQRTLAGLFVWLLPLVVVAEYVGTTFGHTVGASLGLFALLAGALWIPTPEAPPSAPPRWLVWVGRVAGVLAVAAGLWLASRFLAPLLWPKRYPILPSATLREREVFHYAPVLAAYPIALGWRLVRGRGSGRDVERLGLLIALVLLVHQVGKLRVQGLPVLPYGRPDLDTLTLSAGLVLGALLFVPRVPPFIRMLALLGAGLGLRYVGLDTWKIEPSTRDMLPLVKSAQDAFLSGTNPYGLHQMQAGSVVPLTYLPGMWLVWGLPRLLGATDFRLMGLAADAAVVLGLFWAASAVQKPVRERAQGAAVAFGAVWLFSPSLAWNGIYAEPHAWWFVLALLLAATLQKRWWLCAFFLGLALATRHFAAVVAPFVLVAMLRDLGWRRAIGRIALAGSVTAALLVPFVIRNPDAFWFGTLRWLVEYGPVHESWFWQKFGFSGPLYEADKTEWMPRAQAALPALCLLVAVVVRGRRRAIAPLGTAYVLFVMFNGIIWDSFYLGCALFAAFAVAGGHTLARAPAPRPVSRLGLRVAVLAFALASACGAYLGWTLFVARSRAGASALAAHLTGTLRPGDVLVDRSDWSLAFVQPKPLFTTAPPPVATAREVLDPALGPSGALGHPRAWFVLRHGRENDLSRALRSLPGKIDDRRIGHYRLVGIEGLRIGSKLSETRGGPAPRPCRLGGAARVMTTVSPARGRPVTQRWRTTLGNRLIVLGGIEDGNVIYGRQPAFVRVAVDGKPLGTLRLRNLPGTELAVMDTSAFAGTEHDVEAVVTTRDATPRVACLDGWMTAP